MHQFIDSADDVIALIISGRITGDDLTPIVDRIEGAMAAHGRVHIFVEADAISGIMFDEIGEYLGRALPLLGKLKHFGRVAIVADQAWIRAASRIESAALPFISYRVFKPGDRGAALAWVTGGAVAAAS